ncbi:MAG: hypothetical protein U1E28_01790 [Beijerinckiaceae bacterium]
MSTTQQQGNHWLYEKFVGPAGATVWGWAEFAPTDRGHLHPLEIDFNSPPNVHIGHVNVDFTGVNIAGVHVGEVCGSHGNIQITGVAMNVFLGLFHGVAMDMP